MESMAEREYKRARDSFQTVQTDAERIDALAAQVEALNVIIGHLTNVALNAHHRIDREQTRIKALERLNAAN